MLKSFSKCVIVPPMRATETSLPSSPNLSNNGVYIILRHSDTDQMTGTGCSPKLKICHFAKNWTIRTIFKSLWYILALQARREASGSQWWNGNYSGSRIVSGIRADNSPLNLIFPGLEVSVPIGQLAPGAIQPFRIWPQRLVRRHSDSEDRIYEGCFVLGLDVEQSTLSTAADVAERWKLRVQEDDLTVVGQCFVDVIISQGKSNIEKQDLKPCTRTWPRSIVKADERSKGSQTQKLSKREKREMMKGRKDNETMEVAAEATKTARKLRPASDVLNRLRHSRDYDIDEFVVGYKDRHSSMPMEKPAVHWAKDTTDEEFIPEHRIEYFKRYRPGGKEEVLWDKCSRLDKIFQNSGSGNVELDCPTVGPFQ
jgi:uncharacterized protein (UPF0248 family)